MQAWHCIALIVLSIVAYLYATFVHEVEDHSEAAMQALTEASLTGAGDFKIEPSPMGIDSKEGSGVWAESRLMLRIDPADERLLAFHEEALDCKVFLDRLHEELEQSDLAQSIIFSPFSSDGMLSIEQDVLASLISIRPHSSRSIEVICKGHSQRASRLLAEMILRLYNKLLASDKPDSPLPPSLSEKLNQIREMENQIAELKVRIQEEFDASPHESVEAMALRSEIMQTEQEVKAGKELLLRIEEIHLARLDPLEYLSIDPIGRFGQVEQLGRILGDLKSMRTDSSLTEAVRSDMEKNVLAISRDLEKEVIAAIEAFKQEVTASLTKKKQLQQDLFDLISEYNQVRTENSSVKLLERLKPALADKKKEYEDQQLLWISAKASCSLIANP